MGLVSKGFTFSAGATIIASEHNSNFDTLYNLVNGNLENANIGASAAIVDTKLAQISTASKVSGAALTGLASVPSGAGVLPNINNIGGALEVVIDGGGSEIADNSYARIIVPKAITITGAYVLADTSGDIVVDIWKCTLAQYDGGSTHPVNGDSITAAAPLTISSGTIVSDTTLTGWTTSVAELSVLDFVVESCTTITKATVVLTFTRA